MEAPEQAKIWIISQNASMNLAFGKLEEYPSTPYFPTDPGHSVAT
jgi:hypothetical protein